MIQKIFFFLLSTTTLFAANSLNNVTVREYATFLNVVAKEDQHTLYNQKMGEEASPACIERFGVPGTYSYRFSKSQGEESVVYVDLRSAMRYCNWKENGEQEDPATTEYGVYELEGDKLVSINITEITNYFLPSKQDEQFFSLEGNCLQLGSLEDPVSWLRSNQVVFHLKERLENRSSSLSYEEQASLKQDAQYMLETLAVIAVGVTCFKYRSPCYAGRLGYERISDENQEKRLREFTADPLNGTGGADQQRGVSTQLHLSEGMSSQLSVAEPREKLFQQEAQTFINQEVFPRTQKIERFQHESPKYVQFMKTNFKNIFQEHKRTKELSDLMEPYIKKLEDLWKQPTTPTIKNQILAFINDPLAREHKQIMMAAQKYCNDFNASWKKALETTTKQHDFFTELEEKENWINAVFLGLVSEKEAEINHILKDGAIGEIKNQRIMQIRKFFDHTFKNEFVDDKNQIEQAAAVAKAKFFEWRQQFEALCFWDSNLSERATEYAQQLLLLANGETEKLLNAYRIWVTKTESVIERARRRYDAINHQIPPYSETEITISHDDYKLMTKIMSDLYLQHEIYSYYPLEQEEQAYLSRRVEEQYNKISEALALQRSWVSPTAYTLLAKNNLPENEKKVLRYFLNILDRSQIDFVREKAAVLRQELDPP